MRLGLLAVFTRGFFQCLDAIPPRACSLRQGEMDLARLRHQTSLHCIRLFDCLLIGQFIICCARDTGDCISMIESALALSDYKSPLSDVAKVGQAIYKS